MYKVILVDDEKQITDGLARMIKWPEIGFELCATARNGAEAIPLIKSTHADLVLTDVRMPEMDGLKLLEYVRKNIPGDVEFIILSGFSDFQYAQKAMQYNVKNYILKPIDEAELYGALIDIRNLLDEKELRKNLMIKYCINDFITGGQPGDSTLRLGDEEQYGLRLIAIERHMDFAGAEEQNCADISGCIAEKIGETNMRFVLRHDRNRCHMVAGQSLLCSFGYDVKSLALSISEFLRISKSTQADILVGKKVLGFKDLHESVQSISACRYKVFYQNRTSVVLYDDIKEDKYCKVYEDNGSAIRIISAFRKNDKEKLTDSLDALLNHFRSLQVVPEVALIQLDSVLAAIVQILSERQEDIGEVLECYASYKKIQVNANLYEVGRAALQFCLYCLDYSMNRSRKGQEDIADKVARYVDEYYAQPIKINDIAERFYVNPAYLGQQFAKKKGGSLNHYINMVRIEKAKEMLANTSRKIYEIALDIGYGDPNYFSSKFYEYTGLTPSDYRNRK
jgi:two-component system, response regulator YesN